MRLPKQKSPVQRLRSTASKSVTKAVKNSPIQPSGKAVKSGLLAVVGLTGLTAASAAVSARRHRSESEDDW